MRASDVTSGAILRGARAGAAMTQRELAVQAGVSQSVIAAYESGAREPAFSTLLALVEATGASVEVAITPASAGPRRADGPIGHKLRRRRAAVLAIAARHGVTDVRLFGSVARGEDTSASDIDLLVHLPESAGLFALGRFQADLEALLHVPVDVVPDDGLKLRMRAAVERDLIAL